MATPDPKYLPKAKGKTKAKKVRPEVTVTTFPKNTPKVDARPMKKKKSPKGDHYVWAK